MTYELHDHYPRRVRISSGAVEQMCNWGWQVVGEFKSVDQHHPLANAEDWEN